MILDKIISSKKIRLAELNLDIDKLKEECRLSSPPKDFYSALKEGKISIIGEIKKASPSKGIIREDFPYLDLAREYEGAVEAVSVLTEEDYFKGSMKYLKDISEDIHTPTLCKDFIFTREQVYLARKSGASSILLIVRILERKLLEELIDTARNLGMEPLVETHTEEEVKEALEAGAKIIGINNRDLSTFQVDINRSIELSKGIPEDVVVVAESGIKTRGDVASLEEAGIDAVLVGEAFMRSDNLCSAVRELRGKTTEVKICGIKSMEEVEILNKTKPHYAGFVFARSKRQVSVEEARVLRSKLHSSIKAVGVFVDEAPERVVEIARECSLDIVQLHGTEDAAQCNFLKDINEFKVWKALPGEDITEEIIKKYSKSTDSLLFDSNNPGGGEVFDWNKIKDMSVGNVILAGGLNASNARKGIDIVGPDILDVSSGVEVNNSKDYSKILEFLEEVRRYG